MNEETRESKCSVRSCACCWAKIRLWDVCMHLLVLPAQRVNHTAFIACTLTFHISMCGLRLGQPSILYLAYRLYRVCSQEKIWILRPSEVTFSSTIFTPYEWNWPLHLLMLIRHCKLHNQVSIIMRLSMWYTRNFNLCTFTVLTLVESVLNNFSSTDKSLHRAWCVTNKSLSNFSYSLVYWWSRG